MPPITVEYLDDGGRLVPRRCTFVVPALDDFGRHLPDELVEAITEAVNPLMIEVDGYSYALNLTATRSGFEVTVYTGAENCLAIIRAAEEKLRDLCRQAYLMAAICRAYSKRS